MNDIKRLKELTVQAEHGTKRTTNMEILEVRGSFCTHISGTEQSFPINIQSIISEVFKHHFDVLTSNQINVPIKDTISISYYTNTLSENPIAQTLYFFSIKICFSSTFSAYD